MNAGALHLRLPFDLATAVQNSASAAPLPMVLDIPADYEQVADRSDVVAEVFAIQQLLTVVRRRVPLRLAWPSELLRKMPAFAPTFPLLAVALTIQGAEHASNGLDSDQVEELVLRGRRQVLDYRAKGDLFTENQILICADSRGRGRAPDLYAKGTGQLRNRADIETMILDIFAAQLSTSEASSQRFERASALAVIVAELFENTHLHGRLNLEGAPIGPDAMRGLAFRRVAVSIPEHLAEGRPVPARTVPGMELSVFDTGVGFFSSFSRKALLANADLSLEWKVLHSCFARHFSPESLTRHEQHRGMGLYEVLRALQDLKGSIEVRTGRLFAYRTFVKGSLQPQMLPLSGPLAQISFPKPVLLDKLNRLTPRPTAHDVVVGSAVRITIPFG